MWKIFRQSASECGRSSGKMPGRSNHAEASSICMCLLGIKSICLEGFSVLQQLSIHIPRWGHGEDTAVCKAPRTQTVGPHLHCALPSPLAEENQANVLQPLQWKVGLKVQQGSSQQSRLRAGEGMLSFLLNWGQLSIQTTLTPLGMTRGTRHGEQACILFWAFNSLDFDVCV